MKILVIITIFMLASTINAVEFGAKLNNYHVVPKNSVQAYVTNVKPLANKIQGQSSTQQSSHNQFSGGSIGSESRSLSSSVAAAVQSKRFVELISYANQFETVQPQVIEVDAITAPVQFIFRSASGPLLFQQVHVPSVRQDPQHIRSEEPAQILSHEVYKPIVQELREIIQPYRQVTQEIKPVMEEVRTIVAHGDKSPIEDNLDVNRHNGSNLQSILPPVKNIQQVVGDTKSSNSVDFA